MRESTLSHNHQLHMIQCVAEPHESHMTKRNQHRVYTAAEICKCNEDTINSTLWTSSTRARKVKLFAQLSLAVLNTPKSVTGGVLLQPKQWLCYSTCSKKWRQLYLKETDSRGRCWHIQVKLLARVSIGWSVLVLVVFYWHIFAITSAQNSFRVSKWLIIIFSKIQLSSSQKHY